MSSQDIEAARHRFLDVVPDAAILTSYDRKVVACNKHAEEFFQSELLDQDIVSFIRSPQFSAAFLNAISSNDEEEVNMEFRGSPNTHVRIYLRNLPESKLIAIFIRDFTREQAVEKMRTDFVANASHEMRTPLASIIASIETLQGAAKNDAKARDQFLGTMLAQAQRMKRLIDDLLALSHIELNQHVRPLTTVSLPDVARQAKNNLSIAAKSENVTISLRESGAINVAGDADEILQVVLNLLENAIKYGSSGGKVEVNCYADGDYGILAVQDFGSGISEIHLPRLTERFYRVSTKESRMRGGTGLGLAIVKHIMLRHRGKLTITSKEGAGSTFTVSIPLIKSMI